MFSVNDPESEVDVGIAAVVAFRPVANFKIARIRCTAIHKVVTIGNTGRKPCNDPLAQNLLPSIANQRYVAIDDIDKFILVAVPMSLGRCGTGLQCNQIDTEVR